jgi:hypothetical protein
MVMAVVRLGLPCCLVEKWHEIPQFTECADELSMPKVMVKVGIRWMGVLLDLC